MNLIKEKFMEIDLLNFMGLSSEAYTLCYNLWEGLPVGWKVLLGVNYSR